MNEKKLRWGIIATGGIAEKFAKGLEASKTGQLIAAASRNIERAREFTARHTTPEQPVKAYGSYDDLLADPAVEAVYIATPHPQHAQWSIAAARAGKHFLCEKPVAMNHAEAAAIFEAARQHNVFAMEAFMYRCHPQTRKLVDLIRTDAIGEVKVIQSAFSFRSEAGLENRLINPQLGGGGILDLGCYPVSMSRLIAGAALGEPFADPLEVQGFGHMEENGAIDAYAVANLKFRGDILAQMSVGVRVGQDNVLRIYGTKGWILVPRPWAPAPEGGVASIQLFHEGQSEPERIEITAPAPIYSIEADTVAANIASRQTPAMSWDDSLGNMWVLDQWRAAIGLKYSADQTSSRC